MCLCDCSGISEWILKNACPIIVAQGDSSYLSGCFAQSEHIAEKENSTQSLSQCCSLRGPPLEKHNLACIHFINKTSDCSLILWHQCITQLYSIYVTSPLVEPVWIQRQWEECPCHSLSAPPTMANWEACSDWNVHIYLPNNKNTH